MWAAPGTACAASVWSITGKAVSFRRAILTRPANARMTARLKTTCAAADKKVGMRAKIKKIIAREGLMLIALAVVLYFVLSFCGRVPVALPKYKAQFTDGKEYIIDIYPDINYSKALNSKALLKEIHNPQPKLVLRRIEEFAKRTGIKSKVIDTRCVNKLQLRLSRAYAGILSQPFMVKALFIYVLLLIGRFIVWAVRLLN